MLGIRLSVECIAGSPSISATYDAVMVAGILHFPYPHLLLT